jgi:hypothetical protein
MIIKAKKDLRNLPWPPPLKDNDHHSPALQWSLLLHIMEKVSICWEMIPKMVRSNLINAKHMWVKSPQLFQIITEH